MKNLKVIFMGTPDFSVPILEYLIKNTNVVLVVTQPDKEVGRKKEITFSPIKKKAIEYGIDVFQPIKIKKDFEIISEINPDIIITAAYGQIIPQGILDIPKYGCINVHASLLPKYRGAAPIQWCLLNGEEKTGVTLMYMDKGMDTGDMIDKKEYTILPGDNVGSLHDKLSLLGVDLLKDNLPRIINDTNSRIKQDDSLATYAPMITREDEHLDFTKSGIEIINKIRALNPWPLSNIIINDVELKIIDAIFIPKEGTDPYKITYLKKEMLIDCIDGQISLLQVKPNGKKIMDISSYLNGIKKEKDTYGR